MNTREQITEYIYNLVSSNLSNDFRTIRRQYKPYDTFMPVELPALCVIPSDEERRYEGHRMIAQFTVILRIIIYSETDITTQLNNLISKVDDLLASDPYLGGNSAFPARIVTIETSSNWLIPYELADVNIHTFYTRCESW